MQNNDQKPIISAILLVGVLIAGAILLKGSKPPAPAAISPSGNGIPVPTTVATTPTLAPVGSSDRTLGNANAKVTLVMYEDFQCPFCGAVNGLEPNSSIIQSLRQRDPSWTPFMPEIMSNYVKTGKVLFVFRDFPLSFLGPESMGSAEAARCAGEQGKFWEFHDYLYGHQNGEGQGAFSDPNLKSFAKTLNLNTASFDKCLDSKKFADAINASEAEGKNAGVIGTPKGFILRDGKIVSTIDGAEPLSAVKPKIDAALK